MKRLIQLFVLQFTSYFLIVANTRTISKGSYWGTAMTDIFISAQGFLAIKIITGGDKKDWQGTLAYAAGGACGSVVSLYLMRRLGL